MGWLWASPTAEKAPAPTDQKAIPPSSTSTSTSTPSPSEEPIDPEVQKFLDLFNAKPEPPKPSSPSSSSSSSSQQQPSDKSSISSWFALRSSPSSTASRTVEPAPPGSPLAESLLPAEMSCRQAFDQAWACNSMGGQWNAVYRYGEMRSCSEHWDDFWFCMRTKSYGEEMRAEAVRARYRDKEHAKYGRGRPSSEDVWQSRDEKVEPGSVFNQSIE